MGVGGVGGVGFEMDDGASCGSIQWPSRSYFPPGKAYMSMVITATNKKRNAYMNYNKFNRKLLSRFGKKICTLHIHIFFIRSSDLSFALLQFKLMRDTIM